MPRELPAPKFQRFEQVVIKSDAPRLRDFAGERGTVAWIESSAVQNADLADRWGYVVHVPAREVWMSFFQSELESLGEFEPESSLLGTRPEISFDLLFDDDGRCDFMEGCYRLPGEFWKVVIFTKNDVSELRVESSRWQRASTWEGAIDGIVLCFPRGQRLRREDALDALSQAVGHGGWVEVRGPDSMLMR